MTQKGGERKGEANIICVAQISAGVASVWASVYKTFGVVDVSVACCAPHGSGGCRVGHVEEGEATAADIGARKCSDSSEVLLLLIDDHVMGSAGWQ